MKTLFTAILITFSTLAIADIEDCFKDAKTHGNHWHAISPSTECAEAVKAHPDKIEIKSSDNSLHVYGMKNMFFIEKSGKRELMSGDQTELKNILKFFLNEKNDKLIVLQNNSVSIFRLDFIGNVAPLKYFKSSIVVGAENVKLLADQNLLAILSPGKVYIVNADAESRYKEDKFTPKLIHDISYEFLSSPSDIAVDEENKIIHVLNEEKLVSFKMNKDKKDLPQKILSVPEAKSLKMAGKKLFFIKKSGHEVEVFLTK